VPFLVAGLRDESFYPRDECAWSLGRIGASAVAPLLRAIPGLDERALPFVGLALGVSGLRDALAPAVDVLVRCVDSHDDEVVRDAVYFLGEIGAAGARPEVVRSVTGLLSAADLRLARAAAWCWGRIAGRADLPVGVAELVDLARSHAVDCVRAEAVAAIGNLALRAQDPEWIAELARVLVTDCAGRVRYSAMQALRVAVEHGWDDAGSTAARHTEDEDFGVRFEQRLAVGGAPPRV
jgi:HEAT repeat protein